MNEVLQKLKSVRWSGPLLTSVASIIVISAIVFAGLPGVVSAMAAPSWDGNSEDVFAALTDAHNRQAEISARRFQGRSPFVVPSRPRTRPAAPRAETPKPRPRPEAPKIETGPPKSYTGPEPIGVAGPYVFFSANTQILVGQEDNGVEVIAILSANIVKLGHKGGEYEVSFLKANPESIFTPFKSLNSSSVLGRANPNATAKSTPTKTSEASTPAAVFEPEPKTALSDDDRGDGDVQTTWIPAEGSRVAVTFNDGGVTRSLTGNLEYLDGSGSSRNMVVRGTVEGRTVYQRITGDQLVTMNPVTEETVANRDPESISELPTEELEEIEPVEVIEDTSETIDPSIEATLRGMSFSELSDLNVQLAARLESSDLSEEVRVGIEIEIRLINELLREPPPQG